MMFLYTITKPAKYMCVQFPPTKLFSLSKKKCILHNKYAAAVLPCITVYAIFKILDGTFESLLKSAKHRVRDLGSTG